MSGCERFRIGLCVVALFISCLPGCSDGETGRERESLFQIAEAIRRYREQNGSYPPSRIESSAGGELHSWRVLVLPYLEANSIYNRYDFRAAWNAGSNAELLTMHSENPKEQVHEVYCGSGHMTHAVLLLPSSPATMDVPRGLNPARTDWTAFQPTTGKDIVVLWCSRTSIPWTEPRDYSTTQLQSDAALRSSVQGAIRISPDGTPRYLDRKQTQSIIASLDATQN